MLAKESHREQSLELACSPSLWISGRLCIQVTEYNLIYQRYKGTENSVNGRGLKPQPSTLDNPCDWEDTWALSFNVVKCKVRAGHIRSYHLQQDCKMRGKILEKKKTSLKKDLDLTAKKN
jgi:hypothetical protein